MTSGSTATTSVSITITDTNDNIASFIRSREHSWKCPINEKTENIWAFFEAMFCFCAGSYELQVPENHKVNEKIGVLELEDRDQLQNKEPTFIILNDISRVFGIELSPNKDGNLMLRKVGHWCRFSVCASISAKFYVFYAPKVSFMCHDDHWWHGGSPSSLIAIFNTGHYLQALYHKLYNPCILPVRNGFYSHCLLMSIFLLLILAPLWPVRRLLPRRTAQAMIFNLKLTETGFASVGFPVFLQSLSNTLIFWMHTCHL